MSESTNVNGGAMLDMAKGAVRRNILRGVNKLTRREQTENYRYNLKDEQGAETECIIPGDQVIIALMVAPRRCGKTTLMISIVKEFERVMGEGCAIVPVNEGKMEKLDERWCALREFSSSPTFHSGVDASDSLEIHEFLIYNKQRPRNAFLFRFIDVPGEWVHSYPDAMRVLISGADILYITMDAPALIEDGGQYCSEINAPENVLKLTEVLCEGEVEKRKRLMLFVPVKCEKYYWRMISGVQTDAMDELTRSVEKLYEPLLEGIRNNEQVANDLTIAVTPILTVGGVKFSQFRRITDERGVSILSEEYVRVRGYISDRDGYSPRLCDQPMFYTMRFVSKLICENAGRGRMMDFAADMKGLGMKKAMQFAFNDPLAGYLIEKTKIADFREFTTIEMYQKTENISGDRAALSLPVGVYVNNDVLGMRVISDPCDFFGADKSV
ncbi:MAG: hypothetical protein IJC48_06030 [Clostridia bacterium]|nr:hypothetical protein [Clostridia bacterium]MBQ4159148.1 hypothetical protein [Clostridia bacterium]